MKNLRSFGFFPAAVFLGAFLLFQIQPLIGKYFLPWFGGAPAVWLTCLMFFQLLLLAGYAYAHALQTRGRRVQTLLHGTLLLIVVLLCVLRVIRWGSPVLPDDTLRAAPAGPPAAAVVQLLLISIGLAYFLLSTSASLLQAWFHRVQPGRSPYIFYVVSNIASLLALLSYPFLVEPHLSIQQQAWIWGGGLAVYVLLCAGCARRVWITPDPASPASPDADTPIPPDAHTPARPHLQSPGPARFLLWTLLSFCGVLALMALTNRMTQDIPPVPFLWVLPLSIYLLSFIIGFMERQRRWQDWYIYGLLCAFALVAYLAREGLELDIRRQIAAYGAILLAVCLFCHNALFRTKPDPGHLTAFYLCMSFGGALGGLFVVLAAPLLFTGYWEYQLMLALAGALGVFFIYRDPDTRRTFRPVRHLFPLLLAGWIVFLVIGTVRERHDTVYRARNFFGSVRVAREINSGIPVYSLMHGRINHGMQIDHPRLKNRPTTYFTEESGVGRAVRLLQNRQRRLYTGVLGLGIGTLAAYGREGDRFRFYEIDPEVIRLAAESPWFTYLRDTSAAIDTIPGDGRLSLAAEDRRGDAPFDLLVLDAFTGDSPPAHLLTLEAFDLYLRRLAPDGLLAANISNRYLDLLPVLDRVREHFGLHMAYIQSSGDMKISASAQWVLLTRDPDLLRQPLIARADSLDQRTIPRIRLWTDDYSNLLNVIK